MLCKFTFSIISYIDLSNAVSIKSTCSTFLVDYFTCLWDDLCFSSEEECDFVCSLCEEGSMSSKELFDHI
jgi:hypothetical protein